MWTTQGPWVAPGADDEEWSLSLSGLREATTLDWRHGMAADGAGRDVVLLFTTSVSTLLTHMNNKATTTTITTTTTTKEVKQYHANSFSVQNS